MKKLIAKICIWILGKIGYDNHYSLKNEIVISVDATNAIKSIQKLKYEMDNLINLKNKI